MKDKIYNFWDILIVIVLVLIVGIAIGAPIGARLVTPAPIQTNQ